ncbi:MAG: hypothetical protein SGILL_006126 [Bacillariaceae sp.]
MAPLKVAVIGGGPGAMFFCHSYAKMSRASGNAIKQPLEITCFEKKQSPGGVWRASKHQTKVSPLEEVQPQPEQGGRISPSASSTGSASSSESTDVSCRIYDELWTNGPSMCLEFHDYLFKEHFGDKQVPLYFPRKDIHEYISGRVCKHNPTFFEQFFRCNTEVVHVEFNPATKKFAVTLKDVFSEDISEEFFDKCVWAGGENGIKSIPQSLRDKFPSPPSEMDSGCSTGCETPLLVHSTETHQIRRVAPGETILLIGGSYSAEDLALQCLKWGAEKIHVTTRDPESAVTWTSSWPSRKVRVHKGMALQSVDAEGIHFERVRWEWPANFVPVPRDYDSDDDSDEEEKKEEDYAKDDRPPALTLRNVGLVIFCTGYKANLSMLSPSLRPTNDTIPAYCMNIPFVSNKLNDEWRMNTDPIQNPAHAFTGHVPPCQGRMMRNNNNHPDLHRGVSLDNPNMMFLCEHGHDVPLVSLDVHAWLLSAWLTEQVEMPTVEELREANEQQVLDQLQVPYLRYMILDEGYASAISEIEDEGFWNPKEGEESCAWWDISAQYEKYNLRLLSKVMAEGEYPGASLGTYEKLNENGLAVYDFNYRCYYNRSRRDEDSESDKEWKTFRDDSCQPGHCYSLYTKTKARPLKQKWLDASGPVSIQNGDV